MKYLLDQKGLNLVELLVTLSIISILLVAMGFSMNGWQARYNVESTAHDMLTDIKEARAAALNEGRAYFVVFPPGGANTSKYRVYRDTDGNGTLDLGVDTEPGSPAWRNGEFDGYYLQPDGPATRLITLSSRGMVDRVGYLRVLDDHTGASPADADYDCLDIGPTRIKLGRWNKPAPGRCNVK